MRSCWPALPAPPCAQLPGVENAYLRYQVVAGEDWQVLDGLEEGITQASRANQGAPGMMHSLLEHAFGHARPPAKLLHTHPPRNPHVCSRAALEPLLVWNFPVDITFKATNAFGWPQLIVAVYGLDGFGRDVVKGYGCTHLPICSGK
jgi:B9 domain-containing protein 1